MTLLERQLEEQLVEKLRRPVIDYDYIMGLIARFSQQKPGKHKMTREELIGPHSV